MADVWFVLDLFVALGPSSKHHPEEPPGTLEMEEWPDGSWKQLGCEWLHVARGVLWS